MPYAWTNGFRTWYEVQGPADGRAVVLVHGHTFDRRMWEPQVAALRERYRVVVLDLRGHGLSEVPASGYWSAQYAQDLEALLDSLGLQRVALVGNSVGGSSVVDLTLRSPERVAALVLSNSAVGRRPETEAERAMHRGMWEVTAARGFHAALEQVWLPSHLFEGARRRPEVLSFAREMCAGYSGQGFRDPQRANVEQPLLYERFAELRCPTLVIYGDLDHEEVALTANVAAKTLAGCERVVLAGTGHLANYEEPHAYNAALLDFLDRRLDMA